MTIDELRKEIEDSRDNLLRQQVDEKDIMTQEEQEKQERIYRRALEIGIDLLAVDGASKYDEYSDYDYYRDKAFLYIIQDQEIPKDLRDLIEKERKKIERKKGEKS